MPLYAFDTPLFFQLDIDASYRYAYMLYAAHVTIHASVRFMICTLFRHRCRLLLRQRRLLRTLLFERLSPPCCREFTRYSPLFCACLPLSAGFAEFLILRYCLPLFDAMLSILRVAVYARRHMSRQ